MISAFARYSTTCISGFVLTAVLLSACGGGGDSTPPITQPVVVTGVALSTTAQSLNGFGTEFTVQASILPSNASGSVAWSSDNPAVATVTANGSTATVRAIGGGTTRVVANVGKIESSVNVTVVPIVRSITVPVDTIRIVPTNTAAIAAVVNGDAGANTAVTYNSNATTIATVSSSGVVTAVAPGVATITITSTAFPLISATQAVRVTPPVVTVEVTPQAPSVVAGATRQLTASVTATAGIATTVTWSSNANAIATVNAAGLVTAVSAGQATITATSTANPTSTGSTIVTVTAPTVRAITLSSTSANIFVGSTKTLSATVDADAGANTTLTWTSSNAAIASVTQQGVVTANATGGPVIITATSQLIASVKATSAITVLAVPGTTNFTVSKIGTAPYLGGYGAFSLQSTSINSFLVGTGTQGGGGGTYANALLQMTGGIVQNVTPACCAFAGLPDAMAAQSGTESLVSFSGDNIYAHVSTKIFRQSGATFAELPLPPGMNPASFDHLYAARAVGNGTYNTVSGNAVFSRYESGAWTQVATMTGGAGLTTFSSMASWHRDSLIAAFCLSGSENDTPVLVRVYAGVQTTVAGIVGSCRTLKGVRSDSLFAATRAGLAVWNGTVWRVVTSGLAAADTLIDAATCGPTRYAIARNGNVYANVGNTLTRIATDGEAAALSDGSRIFFKMDCAPDGTLRVAAGGGLVSRWTGSSWIEENYAPTTRAVALSSSTNGYLVGEGVVYRWNGITWQSLWRTVASKALLTQVYAEPGGGMFATGTETNDANGRAYSLRYNNGTFTAATMPDVNSFLSLAGIGNGIAYAVGRRSTTGMNSVFKFDNGAWTDQPSAGTGATFIGASAPDNVIAIGTSGYAQRFNGTSWSPIAATPATTPTAFRVLSPTFAMVSDACFGGTSRIYIFNGTSWTITPTFPVAGLPCPLMLFGTSSTDMYALTASGSLQKIFRWNGSAWSELATPDMSLATDASSVAGLTVFSGNRGFVAFGAAPEAAALQSIRRR